MPSSTKVAIAQIAMHWTTAENAAAIERAMALASVSGAQICGFAELAVTGFHREIGREARPELVWPAVQGIRKLADRLSLGVAFGAPTFGPDGIKFNSHLLIDERGRIAAEISKRGLTDPEATFFARGSTRPIGTLQGLRCSAVICREVNDLAQVAADLSPGSVDLIFVPGALRQDPEKPRTEPPEYVNDIARLAKATKAYVVHTNWPNALNRPEEGVDAGGSVVASPDGEVFFRLPMRASGIGVFTLGERRFEWHPQ
jgi:omega-amidase